MAEDKDPFEEYYNESQGKPGGEKWSDIMRELEKKAEEGKKKDPVSADAALVRGPINAFIKKVNALIGEAMEAQKKAGLRVDLIVTLVVGGLAFTAANVYYLVTRNMGVKMTPGEYEETFMGMFRSALENLGREK